MGTDIPGVVTARDPNDDKLSYDLWVNPPGDGSEALDLLQRTLLRGMSDPYPTDLAFVSIDKATGQLTLTRR